MTIQELNEKYSKFTGIRSNVGDLIEGATTNDEKESVYNHLMWHLRRGRILERPFDKELFESIVPALQEKLGIESSTVEEIEEQETYTAEEAAAYNAALPGAIKEGDEIDSNEIVPYEYVHDEESWQLSAGNGVLSRYYTQYPDEDHWNITANRAGNFNDKVYEVEIGNEVHDFAAYWQSDNVQKITNLENSEEVYYLDMFYSLDENEHALFTDAALTESANKVAIFKKVKWNAETCPQCWQGAVNAPGAKLPWVAVMFDTDVNAKLRFDYEGKDSVYPWGNTLFGLGDDKKAWGLASPAKEFGDDTLALAANGGSDAFDGGNFQITLVHTVTAEEAIEHNAQLEGAVKEGDAKND